MRLAADAAPPFAVDARKAPFVPLSVGAGRENFQIDEESDNKNKSICWSRKIFRAVHAGRSMVMLIGKPADAPIFRACCDRGARLDRDAIIGI